MKNKKFLYSMNNISDSVFDKYYKYEARLEGAQAARKRKFMKACALAACLTLCVCIGIALILPALIGKEPEHPDIETLPATFEETPNENSQPVETNEESETSFETEGENDQTGETAVVTQEEATSKVTEDDTEGVTATVETENTDPYEIRVDDYTLVKNENGCYFIFDDISKYKNNSSNGSMVASEIEFKSIKEFKDTVTKGLLEDWQKSIVADFSSNGVDIQTCDFNNLYEPTSPQGSNVSKVYWNGDTYAYLVMVSDESFGFVRHHTKESYDEMYSYEYEQYFNRDTVTVIRVEESDGKEITHYKTSTGVSLHKERYTLTNGNITVKVDRNYYSSDDTLRRITLYCTEGNLYYTVTLYSLVEDPTDEWLLQFGLKRYVDEQDFANDMGIYSSTNLEFWIADNVDNFDFSEHQQRYGLMGGDEYYGKGYIPTVDEYNQQVDPEHCVIYTVTSYPDYSDKEKHISQIAITDPLVTLYGLINVNSTKEEFTRVMEANGFTVERTGTVKLVAKKGDYSISLGLNELVISVDIKNKHGIIF